MCFGGGGVGGVGGEWVTGLARGWCGGMCVLMEGPGICILC